MTTVVIMANSITELGGATRVAYVLASGLAARGHDVHLVGLETAEEPHAYPIDPAVTRRTLLDRPVPSSTDENARTTADAHIATALATTLASITPGVIITTQVWCKEMLDRVPHEDWRVIGQYHSSVEAAERSGDADRLVRAYRDVAWFTLLTQADADAFVARGLEQSTAMPNPVAFWPAAPADGAADVVTYLGRLSVEKAPGILAEAWRLIEGNHPGWRLQFVGAGPLSESVADLQLPRSTVVPATDDPERVLMGSSVLVVPSLVEGFPLSLLEGMACGLAVVSSDASAGVRELVDDDVNGLLAIRGDAADLARQLDRVLADRALRYRLGAAARDTAARYRLDSVLDRWEPLLGGVPAH